MTTSYFVEVTVAEGRNLAIKDASGTSDPYAIIKVDKNKCTTKVIWKSLNPVWNETFSFPVSDPKTSTISLVLWDKDTLSTDDYMGDITIPVADVVASKNKKLGKWYTLQATKRPKEKVSGDVRLEIVFKELTKESSSPSDERVASKFHRRFPELPSEERIVQQLTGSLYMSNITVQGTIYVSDTYVCFYSKLLSKRNRVKILLKDVGYVDKYKSLGVVPNAVYVTMKNGTDYYFTTFNRKLLYTTVYRQWMRCMGSSDNEIEAKLTEKKRSKQEGQNAAADGGKLRLVVEYEGNTREVLVTPTEKLHDSLDDFGQTFKISNIHMCNIYHREARKKTKLEWEQTWESLKLPRLSTILILKPEVKKTLKMLDIPPLPFKDYWQKFNVNPTQNTRPSDELAFEFALHCLLFPVGNVSYAVNNTLVLKDSSKNESSSNFTEVGNIFQRNQLSPAGLAILESLKGGLGIKPHIYTDVLKRVEAFGPGIESVLKEQEHRLNSLINRTNPMCDQQLFEKPEDGSKWRQTERKSVDDLMHKLVFENGNFRGILNLTVIEGKDLIAMDVTGTSDPYCIVSLENQKLSTQVRRMTVSPVWNAEFQFEVTSIKSDLIIDIWDRDYATHDDFMYKVVVHLADYKHGEQVDCWIDLQPKGKLHIKIKLEYPFSRYVGLLVDADKASPRHDTSPVPTAGQLEEIDHYLYYQRMEKILLLDTLSVAAVEEFLEEYSVRFGVDWMYTKLVYLVTMDMVLKPTPEHLELAEETLIQITRWQNDYALTKKEKQMYEKAFDLLEQHCTNYLAQFKTFFPKNEPRGAISSVMSILLLLNNSEEEATNKVASEQVKVCLKNRYKELYNSVLGTHKSKVPESPREVETKSKKGSKTKEVVYLNSFELLDLCEKLQMEIADDRAFEDAFPRSLEFYTIELTTYLGCLREDVELFCRNSYQPTVEAFDVYYKLQTFEPNVLSKSKPKFQFENVLPLGELFLPIILRWMRETVDRLILWMDGAIKVDEKRAMSDTVLHSTSVVDAFDSMFQALQFLKKLKLRSPFVILQFAEVVGEAARSYVHKLYSYFLSSVPQEPKTRPRIISIGNALEAAREIPPFVITPVMCVSLNNIDHSRELLDKLVSELEELLDKTCQDAEGRRNRDSYDFNKPSFDTCVREAFNDIKERRDMFVEVLYKKVNNFMKNEFLQILAQELNTKMTEKEKEKVIADEQKKLLDYLDAQLATLWDNLYPRLFTQVLKALWTGIVMDVTHIIFPSETKEEGVLLNIAQARLLVHHFSKLESYFSAGGSGLKQEYIDAGTKLVKQVLGLYEQPTMYLIREYHNIKAKETEKQVDKKGAEPVMQSEVKPIHIKKILEGRTQDKLATAFLEEIRNPEVRKQQDEVRKKFLLPNSEVILDRYRVANNGKNGFMYLTSSYVTFDAYFSSNADSEYQIAIPLETITAVTREKFALVMDSVKITTDKNEVFTFTSPKNREELVNDIKKYALIAGNKHLR